MPNYLNFRNHGHLSFWQYYLRIYWGLKSTQPVGWTGPTWSDQQFLQLWYVEYLFILGFIYAIWRGIRRLTGSEQGACERVKDAIGMKSASIAVGGLIALMTLAYFLLRIQYRPFEWIGLFDVIQIKPARVPLYIVSIILGLLAYRRNWLVRLSTDVGRLWGIVGLALLALLFSGVMEKSGPLTQNGVSVGTGAWAAYDAALGISVSVGLVILFREVFNARLGKITQRLCDNAYGVYIIHVPIIVPIQYTLIHSTLSPLLLATIVTLITFPLSFIASILLRHTLAWFTSGSHSRSQSLSCS